MWTLYCQERAGGHRAAAVVDLVLSGKATRDGGTAPRWNTATCLGGRALCGQQKQLDCVPDRKGT